MNHLQQFDTTGPFKCSECNCYYTKKYYVDGVHLRMVSVDEFINNLLYRISELNKCRIRNVDRARNAADILYGMGSIDDFDENSEDRK